MGTSLRAIICGICNVFSWPELRLSFNTPLGSLDEEGQTLPGAFKIQVAALERSKTDPTLVSSPDGFELPSEDHHESTNSDADAGLTDYPPVTPKKKQCIGVTRNNQQCKRTPSSKYSVMGRSEYCHAHSPERQKPTCVKSNPPPLPRSFRSRKTGEKVYFQTWIPEDLSPETVLMMREKMEASYGPNKEYPGQIYLYELREEQRNTVKFRISPSRSKTPLAKFVDGIYTLKASYPGHAGPGKFIQYGEGARSVPRLVSLVHLELEDLTRNRCYTDSKLSTSGSPLDAHVDPCPAGPGGQSHQGVFEFSCCQVGGPSQGREWEEHIVPVVERWGKFVEQHVGPALDPISASL